MIGIAGLIATSGFAYLCHALSGKSEKGRTATPKERTEILGKMALAGIFTGLLIYGYKNRSKGNISDGEE